MNEWRETDIGVIPIHWELKTIDEIKSDEKKSIISGPFGSNISAKYFVECGIPVIRGNNLSLDINKKFIDRGFVYITEEKAKELNTWAIKDDIIFTAVGTIGQVGILTGKEKYPQYIISNKQLRLRVNTKIVEPLYAYYWFASPLIADMILQRNTGSSVPLINLSVLKSLLIPLPPENERLQILKIISSLDDKIELLHRQNATLEAMTETLFRQWFVEEAKEEWEEGVLSDIIEFNYGKTLRDGERSGNGFPVYGSSGIVGYHKDFLVPGPGIITGRKGTLGVINYSFQNFFPIDTTFFITSKKNSKGLFFEYFLLKTLNLSEMNSDSAVPGLNRNLAHGIQISIPPIKLINQFNHNTDPLFSKIRFNQNQIMILTTLRDSLLPKLMSGEAKVEIPNT